MRIIKQIQENPSVLLIFGIVFMILSSIVVAFTLPFGILFFFIGAFLSVFGALKINDPYNKNKQENKIPQEVLTQGTDHKNEGRTKQFSSKIEKPHTQKTDDIQTTLNDKNKLK